MRILLSLLAIVVVANVTPPFPTTVYLNPNIITSADPSSLRSVTYRGRAERRFTDLDAGQVVELNVYLFDVQFESRLVEFEVHPEYGSRQAAREQVDNYAAPLGRMPQALLSGANEVEISVSAEANNFSATNANDAGIFHVSSTAGDRELPQGWVEEVFFHEGVHVSLDNRYRRTREWRVAQEADGTFISEYARDNAAWEDLAETALAWFGVRYQADRMTASHINTILDTIPNRLAYLDGLNLNMAPYIAGPTVTTPSVTLSASPNPVAEGSPVTVTATLSLALTSDVTVPLTLTAGLAEAGDYGALGSITVRAGETSGTGTVTTAEDDDTDDETFTVALGSLPSSVTAGSPNSVEVTITDATPPSMSLSASPETVEEGGAVTIIATASETVRANTEVKLVRDAASTAGDEDFSFDAPQMGVITILDGETSGTLTLTATDDELVESDESLTLNGLVGDTPVGSVTLAIEDNDVAVIYTLSGPADSNIVEGESYDLTATASSAVRADTTVEILRDAAASAAGEDDYSVEPILIEAGETTGTTTLVVTADDLPDGGTGTNRGETLVLFGSVGGMEIGDLTFTIWDAAVPTLPLGGVVLLGALLLWRGAVRGARTRRRAGMGTDRRKLRPADRMGSAVGASRRPTHKRMRRSDRTAPAVCGWVKRSARRRR